MQWRLKLDISTHPAFAHAVGLEAKMIQSGTRLDGLGQQRAKMDPNMVDFSNLAGLAQKCIKIYPKIIGFGDLGGLSQKCAKMDPE